MNSNHPQFITCAMDAIEEGIRAAEIMEECSCRLGFVLAAHDTPIINH